MSATTLALACVLAGSGFGQGPTADSGPNLVGTTVGIDGATLVWSLGYARALPMPAPRTLMLAVQLELPMTQPDFGDWRGRVGARVDALRRGRFAWPIELDLIARRMSNHSVQATGVGTEVETMPGWYPGRWFIAGELAWDQEWTTRLVHGEDYRTYVYADVRDGWYGLTGFTMRYGARVGGRPWAHLELWLRGGYEQHGRYDTLAPPVYVLVGVNGRF